jgi:hypothetical protein
LASMFKDHLLFLKLLLIILLNDKRSLMHITNQCLIPKHQKLWSHGFNRSTSQDLRKS